MWFVHKLNDVLFGMCPCLCRFSLLRDPSKCSLTLPAALPYRVALGHVTVPFRVAPAHVAIPYPTVWFMYEVHCTCSSNPPATMRPMYVALPYHEALP